jgi:hypothetical protein
MARTIKVKCNGPNPHVNEVDLDRARQPTPAYRGSERERRAEGFPDRVVLPCKVCTEGRVIITRDMIERIERPPRSGRAE